MARENLVTLARHGPVAVVSLNSPETKNALGEAIFKVVGVKSVFGVNDFVTVTKEDGADWAYLEPALTNAIQSAF